eukprot:2478276-Pyramimonas_sp.AAC.1
MIVFFVRKPELEMSHRVLWHRSRKKIIRRASVKYLDARAGSASRVGAKQIIRTRSATRAGTNIYA